VATARAAKEAIAAGCAVVVCDHRGFAGLVTTDVVDEWRRYNFGRRVLTQPTTGDRLDDAFARYDPNDAARVSAAVRAQDGLDAHIDRLEAVYASILDGAATDDPAADLEALAPFLEDFLISLDFSRPWADLHRNVTDDATDVLRLAMMHHTNQLRADVIESVQSAQRQLRADVIEGVQSAQRQLRTDVIDGLESVHRRLDDGVVLDKRLRPLFD
jgi:hypothetical protein